MKGGGGGVSSGHFAPRELTSRGAFYVLGLRNCPASGWQ